MSTKLKLLFPPWKSWCTMGTYDYVLPHNFFHMRIMRVQMRNRPFLCGGYMRIICRLYPCIRVFLNTNIRPCKIPDIRGNSTLSHNPCRKAVMYLCMLVRLKLMNIYFTYAVLSKNFPMSFLKTHYKKVFQAQCLATS